jgi:hypothetical protein
MDARKELPMRRLIPLLVAVIALPVLAGDGDLQQTDFQRERKGNAEKDAAKDALEGKAPPALQVRQWLNTDGKKPLSWQDLHGKVVVLDFWGVW